MPPLCPAYFEVCCGPTNGSVFIDSCSYCTFYVASKQVCGINKAPKFNKLRIHDSQNCKFSVKTKSTPIIEQSHQLCFSPYVFTYSDCTNDLSSLGFQDVQDKIEVQDFSWLKNTPSPNWSTTEKMAVKEAF